MPKHIVFATHDAKPGVLGSQIALALQGLGASVTVYASGPSATIWQKAGFEIKAANEGPPDIPSCVVCGLSSPRSAGRELGTKTFYAGRILANVPTILLDDDWGAFNRLPATPSLYLTLDMLGAQMLADKRPHAARIIMGDDTVGIKPPEELAERVRRLQQDGSIVVLSYGNKDSRTGASLALALQCLKMSEKVVLIPKFHPGSSPEFKAACEQTVKECKNMRGQPWRIVEMSEAHPDHLAALANITIGVGGTGIKAACHAERTPLLTWSPSIGQMLKEETGAEHHVFASEGVAVEVAEPASFEHLLETDERCRRKRTAFFSSSTPFDPKRAAEAILKLANNN